jgi:Tfp pilus assembly protein PilO
MNLQHLRLNSEIFIWRHGWVWPIIFILALATIFILTYNALVAKKMYETQLQNYSALTSELALVKKNKEQLASQNLPKIESSIIELENVLYERSELPITIRSIHEIAKQQGIKIQSTDYSLKNQNNHLVIQQNITFPFKAKYSQFKQFVFELMRTEPGISIDQITIKRESAIQSTPEVQLKISAWALSNKNLKPDSTLKVE